MNLWKKFFGRDQDSEIKDIKHEKVSFSFAISYSWSLAAKVLRENDEIIIDSSNEAFLRFFSEHLGRRGDRCGLQSFAEAALFLGACRAKGVDLALAEWLANKSDFRLLMPPTQQRIEEAFERLIKGLQQKEPIEEIWKTHPEILSQHFDEMLVARPRQIADDAERFEATNVVLDVRVVLLAKRKKESLLIAKERLKELDFLSAARALSITCDASDLSFLLEPTRWRKKAVLRNDGDPFGQAAYCLTVAGNLDEAICFLERGRMRLLKHHQLEKRIESLGNSTDEHRIANRCWKVRRKFEEIENELARDFDRDLLTGTRLRALGIAYTKMSTAEGKKVEHARQVFMQVLKDKRVAAQIEYVMPLRDKGKSYKDSAFYDEAAFELADSAMQILRDSWPKRLIQEKKAAPPQETINQLYSLWKEVIAAAFTLGLIDSPIDAQSVSDLFINADDLMHLEVVVYVLVGEQDTRAIVVHRHSTAVGVRFESLAIAFSLNELNTLIGADSARPDSWFAAYQNRDRSLANWHGTIEIVMNTIAAKIMLPIETRLEALGIRRAFIVQCGLLAFLPLNTSSQFYKRKQSLGIKSGLLWQRLPSAQFLKQCEESSKIKAEHFIGFADPAPSALESLPEARDELDIVSARFIVPWGTSWIHPQTLKGDHCKSDQMVSLVNSGAQIIHCACHACVDPKNPDQSGILISGDKVLNVAHVLRTYGQGARLAVLSCCESGLPDQTLADDVSDLPTAFLHAKVAGVVATIWSVPGPSTAILMIKFYEEWLDKGCMPSVALSNAQSWLSTSTNATVASYLAQDAPFKGFSSLPERKKSELLAALSRLQICVLRNPDRRNFQHPYYWAGFFYMGA